MTFTGDSGRLRRLPALDGLRGVAALVVVVYHCLMTDRSIWAMYVGRNPPDSVTELFMAASPLRLAWAGDAAVAVFFVLSGYVLARPFLDGAGGTWGRYYPRRLMRLYLPVWAALTLTLVIAVVVPRSGSTGNPWIDTQAVPVTVQSLVSDATLAAPDALLVQLWSLHWEVLFSLLLPIYLLAVRWLARFGLVGFAPLILGNGIGWVSHQESLMYMTVFGFGALLAGLEAQPERAPARPWLLVVLAGLAVVAMTAKPYPVLVIGSTAAVAVALRPGPVARALETRIPRWLGKVSYSLYLVHIPVVLGVARIGADVWITLPLATALSLAVAVIFRGAVEGPSQRLASRAGWPRAKPGPPLAATTLGTSRP